MLREQDEVLVARGFFRMTRWWWGEIERFFRKGLARGARRWVLRVGRRGGKSNHLVRLLVCWALSGMWGIGPGETAVIPILSKDKTEASDRLELIEAILEARGLVKGKSAGRGDFTSGAEVIEIHSRKMRFEVYAARKPVGFTGIAFFGDEVALWENRETHTNPAKAVLGAARPSLATQPLAFEILASAPWGTTDHHHELFKEGEGPFQVVSYAPTWVANDNFLTEERTHELEPDPKEWQRAYKAVPGATVSSAFEESEVEACFRDNYRGKAGEGFVAADPSELMGDAFAFVCGRTTSAGELTVREIGGWSDEELKEVTIESCCATLAARAEQWGTGLVFSDQLEKASVKDGVAKYNKQAVIYDWSEGSKHAAVTLLRRLMRERKLLIAVPHAELRRQMIECKAERTPRGNTHYGTNGLDYLSALITAAHAVNDGQLYLGEAPGLDLEELDRFNEGMPQLVGGL